ncbi:putative leucine-rich repeat-containing protein DDB_G0290503 isoform X2 [Monomorium pharaonis]|uniref:putative leucine-rich repeat-containing protein DDB_G0290503 isoform X2 n=1 Tax=Monomorium pharaonis TaxID=307658 RepID=UPI00063F8C06|nr:putative leucine-rich repeat-containing protein DDB_G0290503 isoform X2 [Monomorium pharaonis]
MELWEKVILEWINCLKVQEETVKSITELQDGIFYINFLKLIKWKQLKNFNQEDITKFIEEEYPTFKVNKEDNAEHIYIASLLLLHLCRVPFEIHNSLQYNMCDNLKNEIQMRVKAFLENVLPIGKEITKETMKEVIMEVEDTSTTIDNYRTPPSENFFNSPLTRSGRSQRIMIERVRELRDLKSSLAIERYTNADLRDDISRQYDKIKKLEKKLEEKSAKIKELQAERFKPITPQPSRIKENSQEDYYKRYINDLENQLTRQQDEINRLEAEKDDVSKELSCVRRTAKHYKENFTNSERSLESLSNTIELKDRELIELRMYNEELRAHIKELNKSASPEQSFEIEDALFSAAKSFNTSEVLSSVIDIQLQEAKEESAILHAQVDSLKGRFDILTKDYRAAMDSNRNLQEKVKILDGVQAELNHLRDELNESNTTVASLQAEKISLVTQIEDFKSSLLFKEQKLSETEESNTKLNTELNNLNLDVKNLNELLENERTSSLNLNAILEQTKLQMTEHIANLNELLENEKTNSLNLYANLEQTKSQVTEHIACIHKLIEEKDSYKCTIEECSKSLKNILHCDNPFIHVNTDLNNLTLNDLTEYIEIMLHNCNAMRISYENDIGKLRTTIDEINTNLCKQQLTITSLEEQNRQNLMKLTNIEEEKKQKDLLLNEQKEIIHTHSQEIKILKEVRNEKLILEQNVHELTNKLTTQEFLLKCIITQLENLRNIDKDLKLMKEETHQNFNEYKNNVELTFEKLQQGYCVMHHKYYEVQQEKEKLEYNFNSKKEELSKIQVINTTLQQNLLESKEKISTLEEKKRILFDELNDLKRNVQELKDINQTLEEQYAAMKIEKDYKLESLKSDNAKILLELKDSTDKLNLLHREMSDTMTQIELKETQVNDLLLNVSTLKTEKNDLMRSHEELLETKEKELVMKEKALLTLQTKIEKLASEANITEKKMKEIIINLQEVRSSQDAVLATQETALKEKCLYIEELQEQFDNSKEILNKELESAKSSLHENQAKFFDLENQLNNQNKTIAELQDMLKTVNAELEASKEYCKHMDANQAEIVKLCQELENPTKNLNSTITDMCSDFNLHDVTQNECINIEDKYKCINTYNNANILNIIKMTLDELHKSQKIISHLSCTNAELNKILVKQEEELIENSVKNREEVCSLKNKIRELEIIAQKRNNYLKSLIKNKESLKASLQKVFVTQNDLDVILTSSKQKWNEILTKFQDIFHTDFVCDEFKQLQIKKANLENTFLKCQVDYSENIKSISDILWEKFLWTEQKLHDTYLCSAHEKECLDILTSIEEDQFCNEKARIDIKLEKFKALQTDLMKSDEEVESFTTLATFCDNNLKSGEIKSQVEIEKKLQSQINQLTKEKKDLKTKMDTMRLRNVKLEKNIDDLRTEIKKLKSSTEANLISEESEVQSLKEELEHLKNQNQQLHKEQDELNKMAKQKFESQLKEIHVTYEQKLEDMKQQVKTAYNEQITKLNKDQEKIVQDKLQNQMEIMCQRQREELDKYKAHIGGLSAQLWSVGEKLLSEQQQKQDALQCLKELQIKIKELQADEPLATISRKTCRMEEQEILPENTQQIHKTHKVTTLITEETLERRHSIRSMQAMGDVFKTEDEEEIFDNVYLADMKRGNFGTVTDVNRLSVLRMRNSLCKPHLKSSYPTEIQFLPPTLTEEEIKTGSPEENFNDSLSQSLLPEQKARKKDRSQISYKKPGPPTPSKNGGRLSLQGSELRSPSSRVLRERNVDRKTTTTPHSLKNIFSLKRQDENATGTPKRRLSSLFRKPRLQSDR